MKNGKNMNSSAFIFRDSYQSNYLIQELSHSLYSTLLSKIHFYDIVLLCIGTDRSTGDSLGPLTGSKLSAMSIHGLSIYGTLDQPVHAMNLEESISSIYQKHPQPYIIAVDACLGQLDSVGTITLAHGPVKPGAGVQKQLPEIGDIHITGIVNVSGFMEYFVLQNTRLSIVMKMAEKIAYSFYYAMRSLQKERYASPLQTKTLSTSP